MKLSTKPSHFAARWTGVDNKNTPCHHAKATRGVLASRRLLNRRTRTSNAPSIMDTIRMIFGKLSRRDRRAFYEQEKTLAKA